MTGMKRSQHAGPHLELALSTVHIEGCISKDFALQQLSSILAKSSVKNILSSEQKNGGEATRRSKMEKYRLVEEHKGEGEDFLEQTSESEVRITQQWKPRNYISYAMNLFVSAA
jgi:hypothetical protein